MPAMSEERAAEAAYEFLRGHSTAELRFDERIEPVRYVFDAEGRPAAAVSYGVLDAADCVLFVPENAEGAMEVAVTPSPLDPDGPQGGVTDRWRIYHGDPTEPRWAVMEIDAARFGKWVVDGAPLMRANPLAADEGRLCRIINQEQREDLARICKHFAGADVERPTLVGVDPLGFEVRRRFDVIRIKTPERMETRQDVERVFRSMVAES